MEQDIILPIDKEVLKSELTPDRQLRMTNKSHTRLPISTTTINSLIKWNKTSSFR